MKLPGFRSSADAEAFNEVVDTVARRTGRSPHEIVALLSFAVEAAVDVVARGSVLRIPGLGTLAAWKDERRSVVAKNGKARMTPRFSASRGFRAQVDLCAPISSTGKQAIQRHRQNHSSNASPQECSSRVSSSAESIRRAIKAQMGGLDLVPDLDARPTPCVARPRRDTVSSKPESPHSKRARRSSPTRRDPPPKA